MRIARISAGLVLCSAAAVAQQPALENDDQKTLYTIGQVIGSNVEAQLGQLDLSPAENDIVLAGLNDALRGRDSRVDVDTYGPKIQNFVTGRSEKQLVAEREASAAYVATQAREPKAQRSESGSVFIPLSEGSGASPKASDTVRVHYHGTLRDGEVFDSSRDDGEPVEFPLDGVIPCWTENVQKMKVGGKAKLVCPSSTAYGDSGPPGIPGGAALTFEVELLAIVE
jgi:FKBP-type peptidyl-prolyl cis-trans isomerase FkpA